MADTIEEKPKLTRQDFSASHPRWCPGCGDFSILNTMQRVFADMGFTKEEVAVVSGIGCSSRFPYYVESYGFHTIHGRAPTVATGVKVANPDLSVWVVTGDGDGLSIGGNHTIHALRRNIDVTILLFNNRIYGLTKGQYSPTSEVGTKAKSTPMGSVESPIDPLRLALSANATFVARTLDTDPKHMAKVFKAAGEHKGTSFVEIMQNCVIFNDKVFDPVTNRKTKLDTMLYLEEGQPLIFGKDSNKGIFMKDSMPKVVSIEENGFSEEDVLVHNTSSSHKSLHYMLADMKYPDFPTPIGVLKCDESQTTYNDAVTAQVKEAQEAKGTGDLQALLRGPDSWEVKEGDLG